MDFKGVDYNKQRNSNVYFIINILRDDEEFKKELTIELSSLKNKISALTDQANLAEEMLIERDK
jgi:hypothetical protein